MTETYSLRKNIPRIGLDIDITTEDKNLLLELDNAIRDVVVKHYGLKVDLKKIWILDKQYETNKIRILIRKGD